METIETDELNLEGITTTEELKATLIAALSPEFEELDVTKLKFVMYLRKSTTGDEKQERSIEDQKADCLDAADRLGIIIKPEDVVIEQESAKAPFIRTKFRKMVDDLKRGKYQGVLSYHPDRLSRNSLDSGELIWLLEEGIIRSFQFATFSFENSPMGKMLLGMSFVLSKQYTDHLREVVMRGQRRSVQEGRYIHVPKHGYQKDITQRLRPDGENWTLIKQAFTMRAEGNSLQAIVDFLNKTKYTRAPSIGKERNLKYTIDTNRVSELLRDPIYCGVLIFGDYVIDLTEIYDFVPMISPEEFCKLNKISNLNSNLRAIQRIADPGTRKADLLRQMIFCATCGKAMHSAITSKTTRQGEKEHRYHYRCDTDGCPAKNKSMPAKVPLAYFYDFIGSVNLTTREFYEHTTDEKKILADKRRIELTGELRSLKQRIAERQKTYERTKEIVRRNDPMATKHFAGDLEIITRDIANLEEKCRDIQQQIGNVNDSIPTYEKHLELYKDVALKAKSTEDMLIKDQIVRKFFLNLTALATQTGTRRDGKPVMGWKITGYKLTPLYAKLLESQLLATGRSGGTRTRDPRLIRPLL